MNGLVNQPVGHARILRQLARQTPIARAQGLPSFFQKNAGRDPGFLPETIRFQFGSFHRDFPGYQYLSSPPLAMPAFDSFDSYEILAQLLGRDEVWSRVEMFGPLADTGQVSLLGSRSNGLELQIIGEGF